MRPDRRVWSTVVVTAAAAEPADDYTANSVLAFALAGSGLG